MAQRTQRSPVAAAYAKALLELANAESPPRAEEIGQELRDLAAAAASEPAFLEFLGSRGVSAAARAAVLERTLSGKVAPVLYNTLGVMNVKDRLGLLPELAAAYAGLLDQQLGKIEVEVIVATELGPEDLEEVRRTVGEALGKTAVVRQQVDESIIGGLIVRVEDRLLDASVRGQLRLLRQRLLAARPKRFAR